MPNSFILLLELLAVLQPHTDNIDRVSLAFPARCVGSLSQEEFDDIRPVAQRLTSEQRELASLAWSAHNFETPEAWFKLLHEDPTVIPALRPAILRVLAELPSTINGLAASEALLLGLIDVEDANHRSVFARYFQPEQRPTLDYWEAGQRIVSLSRCAPPLISGVEEDSFTLALHDDAKRFAAYRSKRWSLSKLGKSIADAREDLSRFVAIDRWVGNTHLTPERLWRWDGANKALVAPQ